MARMGRAALGLILVAIGAVLLAGTLGLLGLDSRRLVEGWPIVFVVIGLLVLLEASEAGTGPGLRRTAGGTAPGPDAAELARRLDRCLDRLLTSKAAPAGPRAPPAEVAATGPPRSRPPGADHERHHADVVAALLELQGLRRNRLISKRSELVARMSPPPITEGWVEAAAAGEGGMDDTGVPASPSVPGPLPW